MKIRKNLSDADMFKGSHESYTFENDVLEDDAPRKTFRGHVPANKNKEDELLLPKEAQEKLNRCLLEVSMEWLKAKNGDLDWKVKRNGFTITIEPKAKEKKESSL
jgi:hypothetical protein